MIEILILTFILCSRSMTVPNDPLRIYQSVKIRRTFLKTPTWWEGLDCFTRWQSSFRDASHLSLVLQLPLQIYSAAHIFNSEMAMHFLYMNEVSVVVSKLPAIDKLLSYLTSLNYIIEVLYRKLLLQKQQRAPGCAMSLFSHQ